MKIVRFKIDNKISYGILEEETIREIVGEPWEDIEYSKKHYELADVKLLAPVQPLNVFAIGLNYKEHAIESGAEFPERPVIFLKASSSVIGPNDEIKLPKMAPDFVDYEAELAIVIGKKCKNVSEADAREYILGYTCANDVSARDCQRKFDIQWARAKSFDTFCPLGPWIQTELNADDTTIKCILNENMMQASVTSDMIFNCSQLVSYISQFATLTPGTVILTGTPQGVGFARNPSVYLRENDIVEVVIGGIGRLVNRVGVE